MAPRKTKGKKRTDNEKDYDSDSDASSMVSANSLNSERGSHKGGFADYDADSLSDTAETDVVDSVQSSFVDAIEQLTAKRTEKRASKRTAAFHTLVNLLKTHYAPDLISSNTLTLTELSVKSLKRGDPSEQTAACELIGLVSIQLCEEGSELFYPSIEAPLLETLNDSAVDGLVRTTVAKVLSVCCFLFVDDVSKIRSLQSKLETIFLDQNSHNISSLIEASIEGWTILFTKLPVSSFSPASFHSSLKLFEKILHHEDIGVRIQAGEAISVLYEFARYSLENFQNVIGSNNICEKIVESLQELTKDCSKSISKKDKKNQRANFRDILSSVSCGDVPEETIRLQNREELEFETWEKLIHLQMFREILGSGLLNHFQENSGIREIFGLGPPPQDKIQLSAFQKSHRKKINGELSKVRSQARGKNRDRRLVQNSLHD